MSTTKLSGSQGIGDIGKWFYLVQGCYQLFETQQSAIESRNYVFG